MFLVNSCLGLVIVIFFCEGVFFFLKLWGYFVEFFRESCFVFLGIFYLFICVGFGYRYFFVEGCLSFFWEYGMGYIF